MNEHLRKAMTAARSSATGDELPAPDKVTEGAPTLWAYLTEQRGAEPGEVRETSTVLLFRDGDALKALVSDREMGKKLFVTATGLGTLWKAIESALTAEHPDWRDDSGRRGKPAPRK